MQKKSVVRLTDDEREASHDVIQTLYGTSQNVWQSQSLLKAEVDGPGWTDSKIADAFSCRTKTVENIRHSIESVSQHSAILRQLPHQ